MEKMIAYFKQNNYSFVLIIPSSILCIIFLFTLNGWLKFQFSEEVKSRAQQLGVLVAHQILPEVLSGNHLEIQQSIDALNLPSFILEYKVLDKKSNLLAQNKLISDQTSSFTLEVPIDIEDLKGESYIKHDSFIAEELAFIDSLAPPKNTGHSLGTLFLTFDKEYYQVLRLGIIYCCILFLALLYVILFLYLKLLSIKLFRPATYWVNKLGGLTDIIQKSDSNTLISSLANNVTNIESTLDDMTKYHQEKSFYFASTGHEIRNPINSIILYNEAALSDLTPEDKGYENIKKAVSTSELLLKAVNDLIDIEKIESGDFSLESKVFNLEKIIDSCFDVVKPLLSDDINIIKPSFDNINRLYKGDPTRVKQVIINLLHNAAKATLQGYIEVLLEVDQKPNSASTNLMFCIKDSGSGISKDKCNNIFKPFGQGDNVQTRVGSGLGLYIVQKIISKMKGNISVESALSFGSAFTFNLILENVNTLDIEDSSTSQSRLRSYKSLLLGLKVLVVDDSAANRDSLAKNLVNLGCHVQTCNSGKTAIEMISKSTEIVIMDLSMPELDGFGAIEFMRSSGYTIPMIAMSGSTNNETREKCTQSGFNQFISKPIEIDVLIQIIIEVCSLEQEKTLNTFRDPKSPILNLPGIDLYYHFSINTTSIDTLKSTLKYFMNDWHQDQLLELYTQKNISEIKHYCHKLAGDSMRIGAHQVASLATTLSEKKEINNIVDILVPELIEYTSVTLNSVKLQLKKFEEIEANL